MRKVLTAAITLFLFAQPAAADEGDWQAMKATQGKHKLYLNAKSFKREGEVVNAAFRYTYGETQTFPFLNKKFDRMERMFYFQCTERKVVVAQSDYYMGNEKVHGISSASGNPLSQGKQVYEPQPVSANTAEEEAFNYACKFSPGKK